MKDKGMIIFREVADAFLDMDEHQGYSLMRNLMANFWGNIEPVECDQVVRIVLNMALPRIQEAAQSFEKERERRSNAAKEREQKKRMQTELNTPQSATACHNVPQSATACTNEMNLNEQNLNEINLINKESKPRAIFKKPNIEEVKAYIKENNYELDADHWYSYYESNGWMVGKNKMKNWKAAVLTWLKNGYGSKNQGGGAPQRSRPLGEIRGGGWVDTEFSNSWD